MKKIIFILFGILIIFIVGGIYWYKQALKGLPNAKVEEIKITQGMGNEEIGALLQEKKIIKSALAFKIYGFLTKKYKDIKAGSYIVSSDLSLPEIFEILTKGKVAVYKITIPEGLSIQETDNYLAEHYSKYGFQKGDFQKMVKNYFLKIPKDILSALPQISPDHLEGIFLGDTFFLVACFWSKRSAKSIEK